jgi:murein DD-endopeptidase MepM/ murein hydrolase activator NlpD
MHLYRPISLRKLFSIVSGVLFIQGSVIFVTFLAGLLLVQAGILVGSPERFALFNGATPSILKNEASLCIGGSTPALAPSVEALPDWTSLARLDDARFSLKRASYTSSNVGGLDSLVPNSRTRLYRVAAGDSLAEIWNRLGAPKLGGVKAQKAFTAAGLGKNALRAGEELLFRFDQRGDVTDVFRKLADGTQVMLSGDSGVGYKAVVRKPQFVEFEKVVSGTITRSFSQAAEEVSLPASIVDELVDLFSDRIDFNKDLHRGDIFTVIFNEKKCDTSDIVQPGTIKAVSIHNQGRMLVAIRHVGKDGAVRYFDENGNVLGDFFLRYPLTFTRISSVFSDARFHPLLKKSKPHNGVDFAAPYGTPVRAVADGVLEISGYKGSAGNMVRVKHDERYATEYMHLARITPGLKVGSHVLRGQVIGSVGRTGLATGTHLHFGFFDKGKYVDPLKIDLPVASSHQDPIPATYLEATLRTLREQHDTIKLAANKSDNKASKV